MDDHPDDEKNSKNGNVFNFPGGESILVETGVDSYVDSPAKGPFTPGEIVDPKIIAQDIRDRVKYVEKQELVIATRNKAPTHIQIDHLLTEFAEELAHIKWERRQATQRGQKTTQYTIARIGGLRQLADLLIKKKDDLHSKRLSTKDPRVQQFFKLWMEMFYSSMEKVSVPPEVIDLVFNQVRADMLEWEVKMESLNAEQ
jgi:hypothetical protein